MEVTSLSQEFAALTIETIDGEIARIPNVDYRRTAGACVPADAAACEVAGGEAGWSETTPA